jgi:putative PEP-CTERM system histidine kinase
LLVQNQLFGVIVVEQPRIPLRLSWEDFDMLRLVSRQAGGLLALQHADRMLSDNKEINTFNQYSAFVVHDVNTIMAQLALILENAQRHKSNPAFVEDMLETIGHAVDRMGRLLYQLRDRPQSTAKPVSLHDVLAETVARFGQQCPCPKLLAPEQDLRVTADRDRLTAALTHVIQNAVDATPEGGSVTVELEPTGDWAEISVSDTGCGMTVEFIEKQLFQPFRTTKGVSGMGIGAYQTREYFRAMGGDVQVASSPGRGTRIVLRLPLSR